MRARDPKKEKAIREKALAMIVKDGFDGLSMQKLAKSAGVSPATIYIYYKDRDDLILKLYADCSRRMSAHTLEGFDPESSFKEGLKVQWINRARYCLKHADEAHFMEQIRFSPMWESAAKLVDAAFIDTMRTFVKGAIKRNEIIRVPVEVYWSVAFAPLYQLLKFHKHGKGMPGTDSFSLDEKTMMLTLELVTKALKP
ncbi:MAG TPA: TetR/AcrR family transcriptional regulator [Fibrobacteria bacterium]|nr:TetR/AcrR family transcriptional regulator [Fibrobacteria bacterium]